MSANCYANYNIHRLFVFSLVLHLPGEISILF